MFRFLQTLALLLVCLALKSQGSGDILLDKYKKSLIINNYTTSEGIASNSVRKIGKSANGFLIVATYNGISAFDGKFFTNYNVGNVPSILSNNIYDFCVDSLKRIWFGTHNGVLVYNGKMFFIPEGLNNAVNLSIQQIEIDKKGVIWIGTTSSGLFTYKNKKLEKVTQIKNLEKSIISLLFTDNSGNVWIGTEQGSLYKYDGKKYIEISNVEKTNAIFTACQDKEGEYYFGSRKGLYTYKNDRINLISDKVNFINDLCLDNEGRLWIASNSGLYYYLKNQDKLYSLTHNNDLVNQIIQTIYFDNEGIIWLGTYRKGLIKLRYGPFENFPFREIDANDVPSSVVQYNDSTFLISTDEGKIYELKNKNLQKLKIMSLLSGNKVKSIFIDSKRNIWICSYKGLLKITTQAKHIKNDLKELPDKTIRNMVETDDGNYWVGTRQSGIYKISEDLKVLKTLSTDKKLSSDFVMSLVKGQNGKIFIATKKGFDILKDDSIVGHFDENNGLSDNLVFNIYEDNNRVLWIATIKGLSRLKNGIFTNYAGLNGLADDKIFDVVEDSFGFLWLPATNGIIRVKKSDLDAFALDQRKQISTVLFDQSDGMFNSQFVSASKLLKTKDGKIVINTISGLSILDPLLANVNHPVPSLVINSIKTESLSYFNNQEKFELDASTKYVQIDFSYIDYITPDKVEFKFFLKPFDSDWQTGENYRFAKYTNLPPGDYKFTVQAIVKSRGSILIEKTIEFSIEPAFYETMWFRFTAVFILLALVWFVYMIRIKTIKHQKEVLENEVIDRTKEIFRQKNSIEEHLLELENQKAEIADKNEEILIAGNKIEQAYLNLKLLSILGQEITSYLNEDDIIFAIYQDINSQMDSDLISIGNYTKGSEVIKLNSTIYKGKKFKPTERIIDDKTCILSYALVQNVEVITNNIKNDFPEFTQTFPEINSFISITSAIVIPIRHKGEITGILTVQSFRKDSYSDYHFNFLQNLAVYIGIAIENSKSYRKIKEQKDELIRVNTSKDKMFSIIGHDLRGPVGTIKSFLDLIIENPELADAENTMEILKTMQQSLGNAYSLLENLLLWARSQRDQLEFEQKSFYIKQPIDEIVSLVSDVARNKNIHIEAQINYNELVFADQNMITTVLRNLISNAIKFTQRGGTVLIVTKQYIENVNNDTKEKIEIMVIDNGIGIHKSDINKILEVNELYSTPGTEKETGSGLGIGICIDFLIRHKQKLYVYNNEDIETFFNKGTTFKFYLNKQETNKEDQ